MNDMDKPYHWFKSILTFSPTIKDRAFLFATPQVETWLFDKRYAIIETAREAGYLQGTATWKLVKYQIDPLEYAARLAAEKGKE